MDAHPKEGALAQRHGNPPWFLRYPKIYVRS